MKTNEKVYAKESVGSFLTKDKEYLVVSRNDSNIIVTDDTGFEMGFADFRFRSTPLEEEEVVPSVPEFVDLAVNPIAKFWPGDSLNIVECTRLLVKALFRDLVDKGGEPYFNHLKTVADSCRVYKDNDIIIVAYLHDTLEDIPSISIAHLLEYYPENIVNSVAILTKKFGQNYQEYIEEVSKDPLALRVKIADLQHNMDITRLKTLGNESVNRLRQYHTAFKFLVEKL